MNYEQELEIYEKSAFSRTTDKALNDIKKSQEKKNKIHQKEIKDLDDVDTWIPDKKLTRGAREKRLKEKKDQIRQDAKKKMAPHDKDINKVKSDYSKATTFGSLKGNIDSYKLNKQKINAAVKSGKSSDEISQSDAARQIRNLKLAYKLNHGDNGTSPEEKYKAGRILEMQKKKKHDKKIKNTALAAAGVGGVLVAAGVLHNYLKKTKGTDAEIRRMMKETDKLKNEIANIKVDDSYSDDGKNAIIKDKINKLHGLYNQMETYCKQKGYDDLCEKITAKKSMYFKESEEITENEDIEMGRYDEICEALNEKVASGELTIEEAELINEAAYDKYVTEKMSDETKDKVMTGAVVGVGLAAGAVALITKLRTNKGLKDHPELKNLLDKVKDSQDRLKSLKSDYKELESAYRSMKNEYRDAASDALSARLTDYSYVHDYDPNGNLVTHRNSTTRSNPNFNPKKAAEHSKNADKMAKLEKEMNSIASEITAEIKKLKVYIKDIKKIARNYKGFPEDLKNEIDAKLKELNKEYKLESVEDSEVANSLLQIHESFMDGVIDSEEKDTLIEFLESAL